MENLNEGKKLKGYMAELAEIDKQSAVVAMEAKINHLQEMVGKKKDKLKMVSEDENLSELIDPKRKKMMEREIKEIEKAKMKLEKLYEKMSGDKKKEVVGEEMDELPQSILDKEKYEIERDARKLEEDGLDETYGSTTYEEDDSKIDEGGYDSTYEEDDSVREEFNRFRKLAGLHINENKTLKENVDVSILKKLGVDSDVMGIVKKIRAAIESGKVKDADVGTIDGIGDAIKKMMVDSAESFLK